MVLQRGLEPRTPCLKGTTLEVLALCFQHFQRIADSLSRNLIRKCLEDFAVQILRAVLHQVRVDLQGLDRAAVAGQVLDTADAHAGEDQLGDVGVPEQVRRGVEVEADLVITSSSAPI